MHDLTNYLLEKKSSVILINYNSERHPAYGIDMDSADIDIARDLTFSRFITVKLKDID